MLFVNTKMEVGQAGERLGPGPGGFPSALGTRPSPLQPAWLSHAGERPLKSQTTNKTAAGTRAYGAPGVRFYTTAGLSQR